MLPSLLSFEIFERTAASTDPQKSRITPADVRETAYFREKIRTIESPEDILKDFRLYKYSLRAFNMDDQINARAIVRKSLEGGVTDPNSFANKWSDRRYKEMTEAFSLGKAGSAKFKTEKFADLVVKKYNMVTKEVRAGEENPAVRLAAYFKRKAGDFSNWYQPLSSTALRDVVMTALQIPKAVQTQNPDRLVEYLSSKWDISDFKDPEKLDKFIDRFLINYDLSNSRSSSINSPFAGALSILTGGNGAGSLLNLII